MDSLQSFGIDGKEDDTEQIFSIKDSIPLEAFVPAKSECACDNKNKSISVLSGVLVKNSYTDIVISDNFQSVNNKSLSSNVPQKNIRLKVKDQKKQIFNVNDVMKAAESNDVYKIREFIKADKDFVLNVKDNYGWNAMMSACCAGSVEVVKLLLLYKPNLYVTDIKGNTCLKLAQFKDHRHIVTLINDYMNCSEVEIVQSHNTKMNVTGESSSFYCEICKDTVKQSKSTHFTSTVHLFNSSRKSGVPTAYGIPESNIGFQMLLKTGWDREKGLGPEGSGQKFPPKTMLKQDRAGLGAKKYVAKVTHDPHLTIKVHKETKRTLSRRERLKNEINNKRKERELRRALD